MTTRRSATERAGIHKYTFPKSDTSHFILDLVHGGGNPPILWSQLKIVNNGTIVGGRSTEGWASGRPGSSHDFLRPHD